MCMELQLTANGDDRVKCGRTQCPVSYTGLVCKLNQSELMNGCGDGVDLVFVVKEVTLSSNLHLFVSQDTFWLHSVASPSFHSKPSE